LGFEQAGFAETSHPLLSSILSIVLKGAVLFTIATIIGADLTGLVAIFALAGFAVVMALQGSPGNFTFGFEIGNVGKKIIFDYLSCIFNMNILARFLMY
jgi:small conductance mechanosensitive channel